jgi:hypothetical protein
VDGHTNVHSREDPEGLTPESALQLRKLTKAASVTCLSKA